MDLNVLIVDDHTLFRKGLKVVLDSFENIGKIFEANSGKSALDQLKLVSIDIVFLDLTMPEMDGDECAKYILRDYRDIKIIMLSSHDSLETISKLIEIGVHSYLIKTSNPDEIGIAINAVISNDFYYNQIVAKALRNKIIEDGLPKNLEALVEKSADDLTKREIEIMQLVCQELTMKEIGTKLFLSHDTIHTHRKNLMKKIHVTNTVGLVKYAIQKGYVRL